MVIRGIKICSNKHGGKINVPADYYSENITKEEKRKQTLICSKHFENDKKANVLPYY